MRGCPVGAASKEGRLAEGLLSLLLHPGQASQQQRIARSHACAGHPLPQSTHLMGFALPHPCPHPLLCSGWRTPTRRPQGLLEGRRRGMRSWLRPRHTSGAWGVPRDWRCCVLLSSLLLLPLLLLPLLVVSCVPLRCIAAPCKGHATHVAFPIHSSHLTNITRRKLHAYLEPRMLRRMKAVCLAGQMPPKVGW